MRKNSIHLAREEGGGGGEGKRTAICEGKICKE